MQDKFVIIPNGYDCQALRFDGEARQRFRSELEVGDGEVLFGMVARSHPQKDHAGLLSALAELRAGGMRFKCALVGPGVDGENRELSSLVRGRGLVDEVCLLGERSNIQEIMSGLDVHVLSSAFGEAFPNVVAEAMACGTPCVVTDVGDAGAIVGDTGWVIPPSEPVALAQALCEAAAEIAHSRSWETRRQACRDRVVEQYSVERMARAFGQVWKGVATQAALSSPRREHGMTPSRGEREAGSAVTGGPC